MNNLSTPFDIVNNLSIKKVIAIDYDGVISDDNEGWLVVINLLKKLGHKIIIVTYRNSSQSYELNFLKLAGFPVYFTNHESKKNYLAAKEIDVDIWIDDDVETILFDNVI